MNVEGALLAGELCEKLDVPHRRCGSLVLAFTEREAATLKRLMKNAGENGVQGVRILSREELLEMEPNLSTETTAALHAPTAMIIDPWEYTQALAETAVRNGVKIKLECTVTSIDIINGGYKLHTTDGDFETRTVLNAAGVYSDEIHNMVAEPAFTIWPAKGEYFLMDKSEGTRVSSIIFQCPSKAGKGVLVTPTVHGNLIVGPGREYPESRDDVATTAEGLDFVKKTARKSVPGIDFGAVIRNFSGNRARSDRDDFIIGEARPGFIDLAGIKSPGLSAAPAIAKMAARLLESSGITLREKQDFHDTRKRVRFRGLTPDEKALLIRCDPPTGG
jgi:glycerol-3-phosphate dehydrogenase